MGTARERTCDPNATRVDPVDVASQAGEPPTLVSDSAAGMSHATQRPPAWLTRHQRGDSIGRYLVLEQVGEGGMGVVFRAYDPELDRQVALKLLHHQPSDGHGEESQPHRARLLREAQALARVRHPNVVRVYDVGMLDGEVYMAMELVEGRTLLEWIAAELPSRDQILTVLMAAGRGLAAAHACGLVHRDFKPSNVLVDSDCVAYVIDFGLVGATHSELPSPLGLNREPTLDEDSFRGDPGSFASSDLTAPGTVMGTPAYMAPEQHLGIAVEASDQFAFAVTAIEALTGRRPFRGATFEAYRAAVVRGEHDFSPGSSGLARWLHRALLRAVASRAEDRFPSMAALVDAISPGRRRRWRLRIGASVLGGALSVAAMAYGGEAIDARLQCRAEAGAADDVWNADRREAIAAKVQASGLAQVDTRWRILASQLDEVAARWRTEISGEYDKIKGEYNRYQAEQVLLSDDARRAKEDEIMEMEKKVRELQKERFGPNGLLFEKRKELVQPIQDRVFGAIQEYAGDRGYDFIFDESGSAGIIFANPEYDKTNDVIDRIRKK